MNDSDYDFDCPPNWGYFVPDAEVFADSLCPAAVEEWFLQPHPTLLSSKPRRSSGSATKDGGPTTGAHVCHTTICLVAVQYVA